MNPTEISNEAKKAALKAVEWDTTDVDSMEEVRIVSGYIQQAINTATKELREQLERERELTKAANAGRPIGPIVGAMALVEKELENKALREQLEHAKDAHGREHKNYLDLCEAVKGDGCVTSDFVDVATIAKECRNECDQLREKNKELCLLLKWESERFREQRKIAETAYNQLQAAANEQLATSRALCDELRKECDQLREQL